LSPRWPDFWWDARCGAGRAAPARSRFSGARRYRLGQDLDTLEQRVKQETDWRVQVNRRPWVFVGVPFALALFAGMAPASTKST